MRHALLALLERSRPRRGPSRRQLAALFQDAQDAAQVVLARDDALTPLERGTIAGVLLRLVQEVDDMSRSIRQSNRSITHSLQRVRRSSCVRI